jgi:hypothetical protein
MKVFGEIDLSGIKKIVINRTIVWERKEEHGFVWVKTAGGKGYDPEFPLIYHPHEMMFVVNELLTRPKKKMLPCGDVVAAGTAYHAWPAGETLNIARKDNY